MPTRLLIILCKLSRIFVNPNARFLFVLAAAAAAGSGAQATPARHVSESHSQRAASQSRPDAAAAVNVVHSPAVRVARRTTTR